MHILAMNCGSSSIKSAVMDSSGRQRLLDIRVEHLGSADCRLRVGDRQRSLGAGVGVEAALLQVLAELHGHAVQIDAVAHRVVHGGERFVRPTLLDGEVLRGIESLGRFAPLHNPPALAAIRVLRGAFEQVPHVAIFDTAFHATLPRRAREYALPADLRERLGLRRFGFHGISHAHVMNAVADHLGAATQDLRIVSCHLGNGASVAAIEYGRCVETSMGMTPLEGLVMGTRAGDLDPGIVLELLGSGMNREQLEELLNRRSGLLGLTGDNDMRAIEQRAGQGDEECRLAIALYSHRIRKYIGAYAACMGGVDAIAFTGGVGENSALVRHRTLQRLGFFGAVLDEDRNRDARADVAAACSDISDERSRVKLLVVRADEELEMALETAAALRAKTTEPVGDTRIPIAVSARHAHLSQPTIERLFGAGYRLAERAPLSQTGQFAAQETVTLLGPRGRIEGVRLMGPPRRDDQVEISRSDEFVLGVDAPVRISGDLANTPGITLEGPAGRVTLQRGLICARRHIHMNTRDAARLGVSDCDTVAVRVDSAGRDLVFDDVTVRVAPEFRLELHLDTDEANAAGVSTGEWAELVKRR